MRRSLVEQDPEKRSKIAMDPEKRRDEQEEESSHLAESTPFLDAGFEGSEEPPSPTQADIDSLADKKARKFRTRVTLLIALLIVAVDLPSVMFNASMVRILESIYCQQYYSAHDPSKIGVDGKIPEDMCKIEDVQASLSSLRGWTGFWSHLPGLFLAVPFGMLADKYGRKWLFVMNILSMQGRTTWQYIVCKSKPIRRIRILADQVQALFLIFSLSRRSGSRLFLPASVVAQW